VTKKTRKRDHREHLNEIPTRVLSEYEHLTDFVDVQVQVKDSLDLGLLAFLRKQKNH
jgi:hypothetical protein